MANINVTPDLFGEKNVENIYVYSQGTTMNLPVVWTAKYEAARKAAVAAINAYGLEPTDFWIKKSVSKFADACEYTNLIMSHSACIKVNEKQPPEKQFDPECVSECNGSEGGVAFVYRSKAQGLFKTGEATPRNAGCSYYYAVAEKRLFDRVVTALSGLYKDGVYSETESEDFREGKPEADAPAQATTAPVPEAPVIPDPRASRIHGLKKAIAFTGTDMTAICQHYQIFTLDEISDEDLINCESILRPRVEKKLAEQKAAAASPQPQQMSMFEQSPAPASVSTPQSAPQKQPAGKVSPIAQMIADRANGKTTETPAPVEAANEPVAAPIGDTVYTCVEGAPVNFQNLNGKTFDQIGKDLLKGLHGRKNASGRKWVTTDMQSQIEKYIA